MISFRLPASALSLLTLFWSVAIWARADDALEPLPVADVKHDGPVNFEKEILPLLAKSCLACHNGTKAENRLVLETPQSILKGGDDGPAAVPQKSAESLLFKSAAHLAEPAMPPADNAIGAKPLSAEELGLLKLWIDQGATGEVARTGGGPVQWQPLPPGVNPIYAVAVTPDGQFAACGRANQVFVYHLPSGRLVTRLTDAELLKTGLYKNEGVAHIDMVQSLAFSPDGELLASGAYREVKLWRRPRDVKKLELAGLAEPAQAMAISPDGSLAAAGDAKGTITLWNLADGKSPRTLAGHSAAVTALAFLPAASASAGATTTPLRLVSGSADKSLRVWSVADGAPLGRVDTPAPVTALAILADNQRVASGGADNLVSVWTLPAASGAGQPSGATDAAGAVAAETLAPGVVLTGHAGPITSIVALPNDPNMLFSAAQENTIRQWDLRTGQMVRQIDHGGPVAALAIRGDGKQLASAGGTNLVRLWNVESGQPWTGANNQPVAELKGDLRAQLGVASMERLVKLATDRAADLKKSSAEAEAKIGATAEAVKAAAAAKETAVNNLAEKNEAAVGPVAGKDVAAKDSEAAGAAAKAALEKSNQAKEVSDKDAQNAELKKGADEAKQAADEAEKLRQDAEKKLESLTAAAKKAQQEVSIAEAANMAAEQAEVAAMAANKKAVDALPVAQAAAQTADEALAAAQARNEETKKQASVLEKPFRALAYSADNRQLAAGGENQLVRTFSADSGSPLDTFAGQAATVAAVAFTPTGDLVSLADKKVVEWNTAPAWTLERVIGNVDDPAILVDRVLALAFSPDGKLLATGGGEPSRSGELKIWTAADGKLVRAITPSHSDTVFGIEFSSDGVLLASASADRFVKVFDVAAGTLVKSFEGHTHHVLDVAWRSDGKLLASGGGDNVIKLWDFTTGDQKLTTQPLPKEVTSVTFVGLSNKYIASCGDRQVRLYNADGPNPERGFSGPGDFIYAAAVTADGNRVVAGGQDSTLFEWNTENGQPIHSYPAPKPLDAPPAGK